MIGTMLTQSADARLSSSKTRISSLLSLIRYGCQAFLATMCSAGGGITSRQLKYSQIVVTFAWLLKVLPNQQNHSRSTMVATRAVRHREFAQTARSVWTTRLVIARIAGTHFLVFILPLMCHRHNVSATSEWMVVPLNGRQEMMSFCGRQVAPNAGRREHVMLPPENR